MRSNNYDSQGRKLCTGPMHGDNGAYLPRRKFGRHPDGKLLSQCRRCRALVMGRNPDNTLVPISEAMPFFLALAEYAGSATKAARMLGVPRQFYTRLKRARAVRGQIVKDAKKILFDAGIKAQTKPVGVDEFEWALFVRYPVKETEPDKQWWYFTGMEWVPRYGEEMLGDDF